MSLVLQSSGGGQITINEPATASNFTQTLPAASGEVMVSGNQPAFSAYQSVAQTLSSSTNTKIQFQTEEFDTANAFDNTTNYRFTPQVAGYYQASGSLRANTSFNTMQVFLYKNGIIYKTGSYVQTNMGQSTVSCLVYLNGTTDFIELYGIFGTGQLVSAIAHETYFQASMVRTA